MFAVISWTSKNGIPFEREQLEVLSSSKYVVMNGEEEKPGAQVNMVFRKDIWGGVIHSIHDSRKIADKAFGDLMPTSSPNRNLLSTPLKRQRKKRTFGKEFESDGDSADEHGALSDDDSVTPPKKRKTPNKTPESSKSAKTTNESPKTANKAKATDSGKKKVDSILEKQNEMIIEEILSGNLSDAPVISDSEDEDEESPQEKQSVNLPTTGDKRLTHPHFGGKQPKKHVLPKCISISCREEKQELERKLEEVKKELDGALEEIRTLKALQGNSGSEIAETIEFGKVPKPVAEAKNWEEIGNGVWCCPFKIKAAIRDCSSRTALACQLFSIFFPKNKMKGKRLHELDQDIIEAIVDFSMVAKLSKEPKERKPKDTDKPVKSPMPATRSTIKQALRVKCNTLIHYKLAKSLGQQKKNQV